MAKDEVTTGTRLSIELNFLNREGVSENNTKASAKGVQMQVTSVFN